MEAFFSSYLWMNQTISNVLPFGSEENTKNLTMKASLSRHLVTQVPPTTWKPIEILKNFLGPGHSWYPCDQIHPHPPPKVGLTKSGIKIKFISWHFNQFCIFTETTCFSTNHKLELWFYGISNGILFHLSIANEGYRSDHVFSCISMYKII